MPYQTAQASAAVYVWKDAFKRANSLDKEKLREALTKTDLETFYGHVKFAADGSNPGKDDHPAADSGRQIQGRLAGKGRGRQAELSARGAVLSTGEWKRANKSPASAL